CLPSCQRGNQMKRRELLSLLGGAIVTWPAKLNAQRPERSYRISYLALGEDRTFAKVLLQRLHELGYSEGANMIFEYRSAEGRPERLGPVAMELVQAKPDVMVAGFGTLAAKAAKAATTTIPVVFTTVGDPLGAGIVTSLGRPGGNVTGLTDQAKDVQGKRLQFLTELVPDKYEIAALLNPDTPFSQLALQEAKAAAEYAHVHLQVLEARTAEQVMERLEDAARAGAAGLLILEAPTI